MEHSALSVALLRQRLVSLLQAMSRRLRRNYAWIFLVVLLAWLVKTTTSIDEGRSHLIHTLHEFLANTAVGGLPGAAVVFGVAALYAWLAFVMFHFDLGEDDLGPGQVHV